MITRVEKFHWGHSKLFPQDWVSPMMHNAIHTSKVAWTTSSSRACSLVPAALFKLQGQVTDVSQVQRRRGLWPHPVTVWRLWQAITHTKCYAQGTGYRRKEKGATRELKGQGRLLRKLRFGLALSLDSWIRISHGWTGRGQGTPLSSRQRDWVGRTGVCGPFDSWRAVQNNKVRSLGGVSKYPRGQRVIWGPNYEEI